MGIYASQGLEYMFQFNSSLPAEIVAIITQTRCCTPVYFPDVNRLLVLPMKSTDARLLQSVYYEQNEDLFDFQTLSHCRRVDGVVDIQLSDDELAMIEAISNTPELQGYIEHHGWYNNNYVFCTLSLPDPGEDNPHVK